MALVRRCALFVIVWSAQPHGVRSGTCITTQQAMTTDILTTLPARRGHFLLESGFHTDLWFTLDTLFVDQHKISPLVADLADRLRPHRVSAACGPLLGGAFLAQAIANRLGIRFYYTEPRPVPPDAGLFTAEYQLSSELRRRVRGERVAVIDDVISAGSSVRATIAALAAADASTAVVGAFLILGTAAVEYFKRREIPVEALSRRDFALWKPTECPLCHAGPPLEDRR